jgi:phosphoglucosamine mutase
VPDREKACQAQEVRRAIEGAKEAVGASGRLIVRPSGTQSLIRIVAEGPDETRLREAVAQIVHALTTLPQDTDQRPE